MLAEMRRNDPEEIIQAEIRLAEYARRKEEKKQAEARKAAERKVVIQRAEQERDRIREEERQLNEVLALSMMEASRPNMA